MDRKLHWENIYSTKALTEVSWYQPVPEQSLTLIQELVLNHDASIIDIGGGDSYLVDYLLKDGYTAVSVLDISAAAIDRAKSRLGNQANKVRWIIEDVTHFHPSQSYDVWYDRATFHFLTEEEDIATYVSTVTNAVKSGGYLILGTFSENGPKKCSGIEIKQYSIESLQHTFEDSFDLLKGFYSEHMTPFATTQNFTFGVFKRK